MNLSSGNDHRPPRNSKEAHRDRDNHREEKASTQRSTVNNGASTTDRAFKDKHHPLLIAIWNTDRTQTNVEEKLKGLRELIRKGTSKINENSFLKNKILSLKDPSVSCEILHEQTGTPIAQVSPLIIACFEGDIDIIRFFIEV